VENLNTVQNPITNISGNSVVENLNTVQNPITNISGKCSGRLEYSVE
jgi:hypothetical protein